MKTIYEKHPVSPERKAELRAKGYKIIDARFAPGKQEQADHDKADHDKADGGQDAKDLTVAELRDALEAKGVDIPEGAKKADLVELLEKAQG